VESGHVVDDGLRAQADIVVPDLFSAAKAITHSI
jgi:hypothetical protein